MCLQGAWPLPPPREAGRSPTWGVASRKGRGFAVSGLLCACARRGRRSPRRLLWRETLFEEGESGRGHAGASARGGRGWGGGRVAPLCPGPEDSLREVVWGLAAAGGLPWSGAAWPGVGDPPASLCPSPLVQREVGVQPPPGPWARTDRQTAVDTQRRRRSSRPQGTRQPCPRPSDGDSDRTTEGETAGHPHLPGPVRPLCPPGPESAPWLCTKLRVYWGPGAGALG